MVSVIVPIYNVENYVKKCLDSLAAQTLEDVEFILIDDGSTDNSSKIADQYSSDPRFHVFHTENRGLSAARNYGIDQSHGEYLMFVDGDDWVAPDFCRIPYETAITNNADLVIFQEYRVKKEKTQKKKNTGNCHTGNIDNLIAIKFGSNVAWNKLYKRKLFDSIRYPEGKVYEDIATTYKLVHIAKRIYMIDNYLYYHIVRKGSITNTRSSLYCADFFMAAKKRYEDMVSYGYPEDILRPILWSAAIGYLIHRQPCNEDMYIQSSQIVDSIVGIPKQISVKHKIALAVWKIDKRLFAFVCKEIGKIKTQ